MLEELAQLPPVYGVLFLGAAAIIAWRIALSWWKRRQVEQDRAFKMELLAQNYSIADIERLLQSEKNQTSLWMVSFPTAAAGTPQNGAGVSQPETAAPAVGETRQGWLSFGEWYEQRFGGIPLIFQALIWLLYGYLWIPLCYLATRPRGTPPGLAPT